MQLSDTNLESQSEIYEQLGRSIRYSLIKLLIRGKACWSWLPFFQKNKKQNQNPKTKQTKQKNNFMTNTKANIHSVYIVLFSL